MSNLKVYCGLLAVFTLSRLFASLQTLFKAHISLVLYSMSASLQKHSSSPSSTMRVWSWLQCFQLLSPGFQLCVLTLCSLCSRCDPLMCTARLALISPLQAQGRQQGPGRGSSATGRLGTRESPVLPVHTAGHTPVESSTAAAPRAGGVQLTCTHVQQSLWNIF